MEEVFAVAVFVVVLVVIAAELANRTVAALDKTGLFEYLAIKSAQWGKARPGRIMVLLSVVTAVLSAFLDNVTTVILMVPVTFLIADTVGVSAMPFLLTQVMASN